MHTDTGIAQGQSQRNNKNISEQQDITVGTDHKHSTDSLETSE